MSQTRQILEGFQASRKNYNSLDEKQINYFSIHLMNVYIKQLFLMFVPMYSL